MTTRHVEVDGTLLGSGAGSWLKCVQGKVRHSLKILSLVATAAASLLEEVIAMMSHVVRCKEDSKLPPTEIPIKRITKYLRITSKLNVLIVWLPFVRKTLATIKQILNIILTDLHIRALDCMDPVFSSGSIKTYQCNFRFPGNG